MQTDPPTNSSGTYNVPKLVNGQIFEIYVTKVLSLASQILGVECDLPRQRERPAGTSAIEPRARPGPKIPSRVNKCHANVEVVNVFWPGTAQGIGGSRVEGPILKVPIDPPLIFADSIFKVGLLSFCGSIVAQVDVVLIGVSAERARRNAVPAGFAFVAGVD